MPEHKISVRISRADVDRLSVGQIQDRLVREGINLRRTIQFEEQKDGTRDMVYSQGGPCLCGNCPKPLPTYAELQARVTELEKMLSEKDSR